MNSTHQVLIASYAKDFGWLESCLRSLKKFSVGFLPPVVCVSSRDFSGASEVARVAFPETRVEIKDGRAGLGNLRAQVSMMSGDILCPDADYVWLVGSDCLVSRQFTPEPFFHSGKPVMLMNSYENLRPVAPGVLPWQRGVEDALGIRPQFEFMRRLPLIYPRALFKLARSFIENRHGKSFEDYVYDVGAAAQTSERSDAANFSESNVLGALAYEACPGEYEWRNLDDRYEEVMATLPSPLIQFWSHGGIDFVCDCDFSYGENQTTRGQTPRKVIADILGC